MIAHSFEYVAPSSMEEAVSYLTISGHSAAVLGGGTMLLPAMSRSEERPSLLVDLRRLGLTEITERTADIIIGARTTYDHILASPLTQRAAPILVSMASGITGGRSITGQGTLVGSACYANPASDIPACLAALDARVLLASDSGTRELPIREFLLGGFRTARRTDEIATALAIPKPRGQSAWAYRKVKLSESSWPIITVACLVAEGSEGSADVTICIGGLAATPLVGKCMVETEGTGSLETMLRHVTEKIAAPWTDELADAEYRALAAPPVARRVLREALVKYNA
ncbi:CO/xanthine dehydrogenase FAD-binding subunit [Phyllobacterium sp. 1468]|uniref:FAD binding domain-containing protein n=1 Tax=Phyllobacterium sp. 1468 TaxID=2817759 RepID=UPI00285ABCE0|nr:FAD binding domain-containing protein [Phyllobacterium sp. 1468]MDR6632628.1 CO/xanthine dehydrogenase FAD-binding subunit [Phyllobacterium sp. 1468]